MWLTVRGASCCFVLPLCHFPRVDSFEKCIILQNVHMFLYYPAGLHSLLLGYLPFFLPFMNPGTLGGAFLLPDLLVEDFEDFEDEDLLGPAFFATVILLT